MPPTAPPSPTPASLTLEGHDILFPSLPYDMQERVKQFSGDERLQKNVQNVTWLKDQSRKKSCSETFGDNYEPLRVLAGSIKQHTLDHLDAYIERFIERAEAAGARVHLAADAEQANAICVDIAKRHGCRLCVKSKSMVTEETQLVPALEKIGVETVETDLGEFILQLDGDAPSHIVTPMIHKDRFAVARAFERELGVAYTVDAGELTKIAREHLRDKYRRADLGVTGGNFLVAETGSLVLCTNEGNARLCTGVPPIHVAMVGIEKLIPRLEDLNVFLKLLARSSTGQSLTVYTHVISGPRRDVEHDGPDQLHIVLIDNGRSGILQEPTREMLRCIRCGACLNACPVYRSIGGHSYGAVYSGPIGALITPMFKGLGNFKDLPHASSLCGACFEACPVKIDIPRQLILLRRLMAERRMGGLSDWIFHKMWGLSLRHPLTYRLGGWVQRWAFRAAARRGGALPPLGHADAYANRGWVGSLPGKLAGWTSERDMPTPTPRDFRDWWRRRPPPNGPPEQGA